jgi:cytochrome c oxidase subunit 2
MFFLSLSYNNLVLDIPRPWQLGFQDPATPIMEGLINVHHEVMYYVIFIAFFVGVVLFHTINDFTLNPMKSVGLQIHAPVIEIVWTIIPFLILVAIALPSFSLLYSMDEIFTPSFTAKIIGRQWYWTYEYSEVLPGMGTISYDSYMITDDALTRKDFRLLSVDNPLYVPVKEHVRFVITSSDVIHSWAVPSMGIKTDAIPGRLNQIFSYVKRSGDFYGQCSELCGIGHAFMPIHVKARSFEDVVESLSKFS